ncbi:putative phiE125 gp8 family phage protein [Rhizobium azibense]|nr:putative phiE125 gp8 family phage protein [Rhizobium azibense]
MKPKLITAPANQPVTLQDVKKHLRVFFTDDDEYLTALIKAATSHLDGYQGILNRCIVSQQWQVTRCNWCRKIETLFTDTTGAVIKYFDADNVEQTVNAASYQVYPDYIRFNNDFVFPALNSNRDDAISITTTHGYAEPPESLLLAIKILIAHWYRNREPVTFGGIPAKIPFSVAALIAPHRWAF